VLLLTIVNMVVWNQLVLLPSTDVNPLAACDCSRDQPAVTTNSSASPTTAMPPITKPVVVTLPEHKLAVVVPFRNRFEEMMEFVPHMHSFLNRQNVSHEIWIINQVDNHRLGCINTKDCFTLWIFNKQLLLVLSLV